MNKLQLTFLLIETFEKFLKLMFRVELFANLGLITMTTHTCMFCWQLIQLSTALL